MTNSKSRVKKHWNLHPKGPYHEKKNQFIYVWSENYMQHLQRPLFPINDPINPMQWQLGWFCFKKDTCLNNGGTHLHLHSYTIITYNNIIWLNANLPFALEPCTVYVACAISVVCQDSVVMVKSESLSVVFWQFMYSTCTTRSWS